MAAILLMVSPSAHASPSIYGFAMSSSSSAISIIYDQPSFGIPAPHTLELHKVHSETAIDSGPSAHALSSVLWPGDVIGNAPLSLALDTFVQDPTTAHYLDCSGDQHTCAPVFDYIHAGLDQFDAQYQKNTGQPFNPPPYPVRAEAFYPQAPHDAQYPVGGGVEMTAHADRLVTNSSSTTQRAGFPGALSLGAMNSSSDSGVIDGKAVSHSNTYVGDVSLASGELQISSITSDVTAVSDGTTSSLSGASMIAGMKIHGYSISVDANGFHAPNANEDPYGQYAAGYIKKYLTDPYGISLELAQPADQQAGPSATRVVSGLIIEMGSKGMSALISQLPTPYRDWLRSPTNSPLCAPIGATASCGQLTPNVQGYVNSPFQFDQQMQIVIGAAYVSADASPTFDIPLPSVPAPVLPSPPTYVPGTPPNVISSPPQILQYKAAAPIAPRRFYAIAPVGSRVPFPGGWIFAGSLLALALVVGAGKLANAALAGNEEESEL
ncbi:MAG: choice-of-anchor P family protein [Actinomycetota bacterium]